MAYRKTEKVLAALEAKRSVIVASAVDVITRSGADGLTCDAVAQRAGIAVGLIYRYFADMAEVAAAAIQHVASRDIAEMQTAAAAERDPVVALSAAIAVYYRRLEQPLLVRALVASPLYRLAIRGEVERLLSAADLGAGPKDRALSAAGLLGALYGVYEADGAGSRNRAPTALLFGLRGIGVSDATARRILARGWGTAAATA